MISNKILLIQDGLIIITSELFSLPSLIVNDDIDLSVADYGAKLTVIGRDFAIPCSALTHFEQIYEANIYFYAEQPYELVAEFIGCLNLNRDEILKIKGAYEFSIY
ncbi:MAG: hypothetical protein PHH29_16050 [Desulfuromonadaceae bacterium]|nr:hypothetical protein [Desulfuromonadaceae bacterium]